MGNGQLHILEGCHAGSPKNRQGHLVLHHRRLRRRPRDRKCDDRLRQIRRRHGARFSPASGKQPRFRFLPAGSAKLEAKAIGIANGGADTIDTIKQAHEFGLVQSGVALAAPVFFITDVHALGLDVSQGVRFVSPFYWDRTDATRAWAARFFEEMKKMPTHLQAGDYTFLMHYFKAVAAVGGTESGPVMAKMRETPIDDFMTVNGKLRENGSVLRQRLLLEVKAPNESKKPWDYANVVQEL